MTRDQGESCADAIDGTVSDSEPTAAKDQVSAASRPPSTLRWIAVGVGVLLLVQIALLATLVNTNSEVAALRDDVDALSSAAAATPPLAAEAVPPLGSDDGASSAAPEDDVAAGPSGDLPRFLGGGPDVALGRTLGQLAGLEYYSGQDTVVDPSDGVARAYMVWAHWCPFCQQELPLMSEWHAANAADLANFELVSVTTAMNDSGGNPLVPYLDASAFPFPVLVDATGALSQQLGANAYPFWVFTAPDGTVVGRAAGLIELDDLEAVFAELNGLEATAMPAGS